MEVITVESKAFKELANKINSISKFITAIHEKEERARKEQEDAKAADEWVDGYEVCTFLKISNKTLQRLRNESVITYSQIRGKTYYKISEMQCLLKENIIRRNDEHIQDLIKNHQLYVEQRRALKPNK